MTFNGFKISIALFNQSVLRMTFLLTDMNEDSMDFSSRNEMQVGNIVHIGTYSLTSNPPS